MRPDALHLDEVADEEQTPEESLLEDSERIFHADMTKHQLSLQHRQELYEGQVELWVKEQLSHGQFYDVTMKKSESYKEHSRKIVHNDMLKQRVHLLLAKETRDAAIRLFFRSLKTETSPASPLIDTSVSSVQSPE